MVNRYIIEFKFKISITVIQSEITVRFAQLYVYHQSSIRVITNLPTFILVYLLVSNDSIIYRYKIPFNIIYGIVEFTD